MDARDVITTFLKATILLSSVVTCTLGDIRCYCNDADCVRDGYMCKSRAGRCFTQLSYERESSRSVHGCVESLPMESRDLCDATGSISEAKAGDTVKWPIVVCCQDDMCNYRDNLDINIYVAKSNNTKGTWSGVASAHDADGYSVPGPPYVTSPHHHVWFRAAVIAVPIAGGFILVLLVLLAVRVLRNDNRRHQQLVQMRHHRSLTKAQLYVADHFYHNQLVTEKCDNPCEGATCLVHGESGGGKSRVSPSGGSCPVHGVGRGVYRDVHIKLEHSKNGYEKIRPVSDAWTSEDSRDSVVLWGDPAKSGSHV